MLRPLVLLVAVLVPAAPARAAWQAPVRGSVAASFHYARAHAYAAGQRRGADFRARPGAAVVAPCTGRVTFAGRVPSLGAGATVRCGALAATVLGLGALGVRRGQMVLGGGWLGTAGADGVVRLGARRAADRQGYVDPLALLGPRRRGPTSVPWRVGPRAPPAGPPRRPPPAPVRVRFAAPRRAAAGSPAVAWLGAALLGVALGAGAVRRIASRTPCPSTSPRPSTT